MTKPTRNRCQATRTHARTVVLLTAESQLTHKVKDELLEYDWFLVGTHALNVTPHLLTAFSRPTTNASALSAADAGWLMSAAVLAAARPPTAASLLPDLEAAYCSLQAASCSRLAGKHVESAVLPCRQWQPLQSTKLSVRRTAVVSLTRTW